MAIIALRKRNAGLFFFLLHPVSIKKRTWHDMPVIVYRSETADGLACKYQIDRFMH
jgi:hypothetical protein